MLSLLKNRRVFLRTLFLHYLLPCNPLATTSRWSKNVIIVLWCMYIFTLPSLCHHQPYHPPSSNSTLNNESDEVSDTFTIRITMVCYHCHYLFKNRRVFLRTLFLHCNLLATTSRWSKNVIIVLWCMYIFTLPSLCHHQPYHPPSSNSTLNNESDEVSDTFTIRITMVCYHCHYLFKNRRVFLRTLYLHYLLHCNLLVTSRWSKNVIIILWCMYILY